ncbi:MAG: hypothetical protein WCJ58_04940 [bacterium]
MPRIPRTFYLGLVIAILAAFFLIYSFVTTPQVKSYDKYQITKNQETGKYEVTLKPGIAFVDNLDQALQDYAKDKHININDLQVDIPGASLPHPIEFYESEDIDRQPWEAPVGYKD